MWRISHLIGLALLVAACAEGATTTTTAVGTTVSTAVVTTTLASTTTTADDSFPIEVAGLTIDERPEQIVSLSATATEMLFAIGAGEQVVAVDDRSNYPSGVPVTDLSGLTPNVEAIASYQPDLVIASFDPGDLVAALTELDIPAMIQPAAATIADSYAQIEQLGAATGHVADAAGLVASMRAEIDEVVASLPARDDLLSYYHELDNTFFSLTSKTFAGQLYGLLGLLNIADRADSIGSGYPQLSAEYIIEADPDLIFLADTKCCGESAETVAARPGWDVLTAVRTGAVVELDDDVASRWGPRIVELLRTIATKVAELEPAG